MQPAVRITVSLFLLTSALASYHNTKLRRDGVLNLYPFPRVGRASRNTWQVPLNDFLLEYEPVEKRQLYAFPRVGRSEREPTTARRTVEQAGMWFGPRVGRSGLRDPVHDFKAMPERRTDQPGMWFGPCLGRSFMSDDDTPTQNEFNDRSEPEQIEPTHGEREKRQV